MQFKAERQRKVEGAQIRKKNSEPAWHGVCKAGSKSPPSSSRSAPKEPRGSTREAKKNRIRCSSQFKAELHAPRGRIRNEQQNCLARPAEVGGTRCKAELKADQLRGQRRCKHEAKEEERRAEQNRLEQSRAEQSRTGQSRPEESRAEQS